MLKKTIALCLIAILILPTCVGCASPILNKHTPSIKNAENTQVTISPDSPNTYLPQVMIDDVIYMIHGDPYLSIDYLPESFYKGQILSTVSLSERPTINGEANFNVEEGTPYASYGDGYIVLWNDVWTLFVTENALAEGVMPTPRIVGDTPEKAPKLYVVLKNDNTIEQRVEALQLTTSWSISYEDGTGTGYDSDSAHPLQVHPNDYTDVTLYPDGPTGSIEMQFSDNYPPQSISIQRWPAEYATGGQNIEDAVNRSEFISVTDNVFTISDDGKNYIYEVYATWTNGNSHYSFQTVSGSTSMRPHYFANENPSPTEIVRRELISGGYDIQYIFLLSHGERKLLNGVDNGELAVVYASYIDGDAIYCMRYDFERETNNAIWTHTEPTFWDGIAIDVAAYVAREYFTEQTGIENDDIFVAWAQQEEAETLFPDIAQSFFAAFYIGRMGDIPVTIILTSPDGQSHWKVIGYAGTAL